MRKSSKLILTVGLLTLVAAVAVAWKAKQRFLGDAPISLWGHTDVTKPAALAVWPWPRVKRETTYRGLTRWETSSSDGTTAILFDFDFKTNPHLRFEIFDQDEDEKVPFGNKVHYWVRSVARATRQLNASRGKVLAAWNGLFFGYPSGSGNQGPGVAVFHVSPVVLNGTVHYTGVNHRWGFGVKYTPHGPQWKVAHLPSKQWFQTLDWGGGSAQCLINDGKPLKLQPFPPAGARPLPQPVLSTPAEVGHIPVFDHMKTCRASLAWTRDNRHLFLLFIKESDSEAASAMAFKYRRALLGGWSVPDLQRFWLALEKQHGLLTAINSDAGDAAQLAYLRPDGKYEVLPARQAGSAVNRLTLPANLQGAPSGGGAIMYFYVRDSSGR